jgi:plasmid stabilization system protein ParE
VKARFTPRAVADLGEIADYIRQKSPASAIKVRDEIRRTIDLLERFPYSGPRTSVEEVRRIVVHRYPYIVYYIADAARREVVIVTIQHGARRQPFEAG